MTPELDSDTNDRFRPHRVGGHSVSGSYILTHWRLGAQITFSVRRVKVALATSCPWRELFETAHARLCAAAR